MALSKKPTLSKARKKAWDAFSLYVRHKHRNKDGMITCYTCGKVGRPVGDRFQAGHAIAGRTNAILFVEDVVRTQCIGCNYFGGGKYHVFMANLIDEIGLDKFGKILLNSRKTVKYTVDDYLNIEKKYKQKLKELSL